ncbi:MAG: SDR family NAD(P)-dependent oxidoreductase [Nannocystaceae bacterium]
MMLEGKVAVVTGGSRGIGRGIVEMLLSEGASVAFNGRDQGKGARALRELDAGARAIFVAGDVTARGDCEAVIDAAVEAFGGLHILVNNAGGSGGFAPVVEMSDDAWIQAFAWNVHSTFYCTRHALKRMLPQKWGRIINISSVEGKHGKGGVAHYVAAKHAINGLTKSVAQEVGTEGVTVNAICPGLILTDIVRESGAAVAAAMGLTFEELVERFASEAAIKRLSKVEEVAAMARLLCSQEGAGITGALLSVDGGTAAY